MSSLNVLVLISAQPPQYARDGALITAALQEAGLQVTQTTDPAELKSLGKGAHHVVVLYTFGDYLDDTEIESLADFVRGGGGLVGVHTAIATNPAKETLGKLLGARIIKGVIGEHQLTVSDPSHPIAHRVHDFRIDDELYVTEKKSDFHAFLTTEFEGKAQPMGWTRPEGKGKVAYLGNGHTPGCFLNPVFKQMLVRSVRFTRGETIAPSIEP